jgi:transcriptional regulator with GAF, ATPase, and Fis domain
MKNKLTESDLLTIVAINDAIASTRDKTTLFQTIFNRLEPIFKFVFAAIILYNKPRTHLEFLSGSIYGEPPEKKHWRRVPVSEVTFILSSNEVTRINISDLPRIKGVMENDVDAAINSGIREIIVCPLQSSGEVIGYLVLTPTILEASSDYSLEFLQKISNPIASAVSNITAYEELLQVDKEKELQIKFINSLVGIKKRDEMCYALVSEMNKVALFQYVGIIIDSKEEGRSFHNYMIDSRGLLKVFKPSHDIDEAAILALNKPASSWMHTEYSSEEIGRLVSTSPFFADLHKRIKLSTLHYSTSSMDENRIALVLVNLNYKVQEHDVYYLSSTRGSVELAFRNLFAFEENEKLRRQLEQEKNLLLDEINVTSGSQEIIGSSPAMKNVFKQINQVAKTDSTVLIQGETGVGKEVIAKTLHTRSNRNDRVFITINCAALPAQLIESELFGHEKGSFTGALERKIGKFELANGGTIFLDEIGELPIDLQSKLLRVLQEKEFERIGGKEVHKTDIRVIAATNRDLQKEIAAGHFRADLFFRLNVFPILIPPLRERPEDIPLFIKHFTEKYSKRVGSPVRFVRNTDLTLLLQYHWPGNIRELEHIIERAVIISTGAYLEFSDFSAAQRTLGEDYSEGFKSLHDMEREHILTALRLTNGRVSGERGAAKLLGINNKTLDSRIKKLEIKKEVIIK